MKKGKSIRSLIRTYAPDIKLGLYTPAHLGKAGRGGFFPKEMYNFDRPYLTPDCIAEHEKRFSGLFGTRHSFFLTGGTTQGILAGCLAMAASGKKVLVGRNCHVSFINGSVLAGLDLEYIPSEGLIPDEDEILDALNKRPPGLAVLVVTNPSYDGRGIGLRKIANHCRRAGVLMVVDEAHGTHFPFTPGAPESALAVEGCDLVFHSLHKYLGSFVQTGLAHLPEGSGLTPEKFRCSLELFESTTRSNLLVLSIEEALERAFNGKGRMMFAAAAERTQAIRTVIESFGPELSYRKAYYTDPLKLFLTSSRASGHQLARLFLNRRIDHEYSTDEGVLFIFSFRNRVQDFHLFAAAVDKVGEELRSMGASGKQSRIFRYNMPVMRCSPREAFLASNTRETALVNAQGKVNCTNYVKCPPGIPLLIPGEEITQWHVDNLPGKWKVRIFD